MQIEEMSHNPPLTQKQNQFGYPVVCIKTGWRVVSNLHKSMQPTNRAVTEPLI